MKMLIRLDDFSPNRDVKKWQSVLEILDKYQVSPLIAVIPNDSYFGHKFSDENFWREVKSLVQSGCEIAIHGWDHCVVPIHKCEQVELFFATKSEYVGLSYEEKRFRLARAFQIFELNGIEADVFIAPNHGFDSEVIEILGRAKFAKYISDGISFRPFYDRGLIWIPQHDWRIPKLGFGLRTICLHPSTMSMSELDDFERSIQKHVNKFIGFSKIRSWEHITNKSFIDRLYHDFYKFLSRLFIS